MPPYDDAANRACLLGVPVTPADYCPLPLTTTVDRLSEIRLTTTSNGYVGTLKTDWQDRMARLADLIARQYFLFFRIQYLLESRINWRVDFSNPFKATQERPSFSVNEPGLLGISTMLIQLDKKLNFIHEDLRRIEPTASIIEHWQLRPESRRPQIALLWGVLGDFDRDIGPPKYQTTIPHCLPAIIGIASNKWRYRKGAIQLLVTLSDNSKIIMYVESAREAERLWQLFRPFIAADKLAGAYVKIGEYKGPSFKPGLLALRRIDYYPGGMDQELPSQRVYFPADPDSVP